MAAFPSYTEVEAYVGPRLTEAARNFARFVGRDPSEVENHVRGVMGSHYRNGFDAGYRGLRRFFEDYLLKAAEQDPAWMGRAIRDGYSAGSKQATIDQLLGYPLPGDVIVSKPDVMITDVVGPGQPATSRGILAQITEFALLTAPAWVPIFALPTLRRRGILKS